jgi:hypothetical protein
MSQTTLGAILWIAALLVGLLYMMRRGRRRHSR